MTYNIIRGIILLYICRKSYVNLGFKLPHVVQEDGIQNII